MRKFLVLLSLLLGITGCKSRGEMSSSKSIYVPMGGVFGGNGMYFYTTDDGTAVCSASVNHTVVSEITGTADPDDFKRVLASLYQAPNANAEVDSFYSTYLAQNTQKYYAKQIAQSDPEGAQLLDLTFRAIQQAKAAANPQVCNGNQDPGSSGQTYRTPKYLFVLLSYGTMIVPEKAHTFGFAAKMGENNLVLEHVPLSWLPILTRPLNDPNGTPDLASDGTVQVGETLVMGGQARLGWSFSLYKTINARIAQTGHSDITAFGAYEISQDEYEAARAFRNQLNGNVSAVAAHRSPDPDKFYYQAMNPTLFSGCPEGLVPGTLNCFQAVLATFGRCSETNFKAGAAVTAWISGLLRGWGAISDAPYLDGYVYSQRQILQNMINDVIQQEARAPSYDIPTG